MVKSRIDESSKSSSSNSESKQNQTQQSVELGAGKRIISCHELEAATKSKSPKRNLKKVKNLAKLHTIKDPSVLLFAVRPEANMKYNLDELKSLRSSRASQAPPACVYEPKIIRLNILRHSPADCESNPIKSIHELMPKLPFSGNWNLDPKTLNLISHYHRELLCPQYGYVNNSYNMNRMDQNNNSSVHQKTRRVSWSDQKQADSQYYENLLTYDQKNFFDNITTSTTMRPPPPPKPRPQYQRQSKGSCANERLAQYPVNTSTDQSWTMSDKTSSCDESMDRTASSVGSESNSKRDKYFNRSNREQENEPVPEWFQTPASINDVIDLRGFDDETDFKDHSASSADKQQNGKKESSSSSGVSMGRHQNFSQRQNGHYQQRQQQFQHPVHQSTPYSSFNSSGEMNSINMSRGQHDPRDNTSNPFFDLWRRQSSSINMLNNLNQMNMRQPTASPAYNMPRNILTISDVEQAMQNAQLYARQQPQMNGVLQQMFQNAALSTVLPNAFPPPPPVPSINLPPPTFGFNNFQPGSVPTREQLQQHTSEIFRNAMMRKQPFNKNDSK